MSNSKTSKLKKFIFFFFSKRFDSGTWTIAFAWLCLCYFGGLFLLIISYSLPKCFCSDPYPHLSVLPGSIKFAYISIVLIISAAVISCLLGIYGTMKARCKLLLPLMAVQLLSEIVIVTSSILLISWLIQMDKYLLFSNDTYMDLIKLILKPELMARLEPLLNSLSKVLDVFLNNLHHVPSSSKAASSFNLNNLMDAALHPNILALLGGMKLVIKCGSVLIFVGLNILYICGFLITLSHFLKLKSGKFVRSYSSAIPGLLINTAVITNSARSTATDSIDEHSRDSNYKSMSRSQSSTKTRRHSSMENDTYKSSRRPRSSSRSYRRNDLDVVGKFPSDQYL